MGVTAQLSRLVRKQVGVTVHARQLHVACEEIPNSVLESRLTEVVSYCLLVSSPEQIKDDSDWSS